MRVRSVVGQSPGAHEHVLLQKRSQRGSQSLLSPWWGRTWRCDRTGGRVLLVLGREAVRLSQGAGCPSRQCERR